MDHGSDLQDTLSILRKEVPTPPDSSTKECRVMRESEETEGAVTLGECYESRTLLGRAWTYAVQTGGVVPKGLVEGSREREPPVRYICRCGHRCGLVG
jgi:hypothetical protein